MAKKSTVDESKLKAEAAEAFAKGKFKKALPIYVELSQLHPKDLRMKTKVGDVLVKLERLKDAVEVYRSVAAQYAAQGMLIQAIAVNKMILQINPKDQGILRELATLYGRKQEVAGSTPLARVSTVIRPIQIREVSVNAVAPSEDTQYFGGSQISLEPLEIQVAQDENIEEIPGRILDFSGPIDLGAVAAVSLPPTPLFSQLDSTSLDRVLNLLGRREVARGEIVCREGEAGDSIFIISEGEMQVNSLDSGGQNLQLAHLREGDFFGEFGYFSDRKRHATVTALSDAVLLELKREHIGQVCAEFPGVEGVLQDFYRNRLLNTLLAKSRIFRDLNEKQRKDLAGRFTLETFPPQTFIMREGEQGDAMYLIQEGRLQVSTRKDGQPLVLATLKEGDFCGEFSVLTGAKRTADVSSTTAVKLLKLSKDAARQFLGEHATVFKSLQNVADERVAGTIKALTGVSTTAAEGPAKKGGLV